MRTISTATENGNTVTLTLSAPVPDGLTVGATIRVSGVSVANYNGPIFNVLSVSGSTLTYYRDYTGLGAGSGGTVTVLLVGLTVGSRGGASDTKAGFVDHAAVSDVISAGYEAA